MGTIQLTGYRGHVEVMTTELNSLAGTSGKGISGVLDNGDTHNMWGDFHLRVTFAVAPTNGDVMSCFIIRSLDDGTTYADGSASVEPSPTTYVGGFIVRNVTTQQIMPLYGIGMPPGKFKIVIKNGTSQATPASGSTLTLNQYAVDSG